MRFKVSERDERGGRERRDKRVMTILFVAILSKHVEDDSLEHLLCGDTMREDGWMSGRVVELEEERDSDCLGRGRARGGRGGRSRGREETGEDLVDKSCT
jgi:hypothetical protein